MEGPPQQPDEYTVDSSPVSGQTLQSASPFTPSISQSIYHRPGYQRVTSEQEEEDIVYKGASGLQEGNGEHDSVRGLCINFSRSDEQPMTFGATVAQPGSVDYLLSPTSARSTKRSQNGLDNTPDPDGNSAHSRSPSSLYQPFTADDELQSLRRETRSSTFKSSEPSGITDELRCTTRRNFHFGRGHWLSVTIFILSIYSTIFSGIWLGLAAAKPRFGKHITDNGPLPPSTASLLCAAFAKTIELSFVTVFVAFLGQVLSQRAIEENSKGITIAEMQMRVWILQPGTLLTHWESVRYAALSFLGAISLAVALVAMLYTTASDALVAPKLKFGAAEHKVLYGTVKTIYGNESYQIEHCKSPMNANTDPWYYGPTCMAIEHSGQAYHNYAQFLGNWNDVARVQNGSVAQGQRPSPVGMLYDNTTVQGSWIDEQDMGEVSNRFDRIINNVTMAMPLAALFGAVREPINSILQPQDLNGLGEYYVQASLPSPSVNVLCAETTPEELSPMIIVDWKGYNGTEPNATNYPDGYSIPPRPSWLNETKVDDLFGFGEKYGRRHPVFPKLPKPFNTVLNTTDLESDSVYILATSPDRAYMLCSIRSWMSPDCSTEYHASMSGGSMTTRCNDPTDQLAYRLSQPLATSGVTNVNWTTIAVQWALTLSLGAGIIDGAASNARLLSQLMPTTRALDPNVPSIAEALAVMAGCTLLLSSLDSPFTHDWNNTDTTYFQEPQYQAFNATVRSQDYSSGGTQHWQGMFYVVLAAVFLTNAFCLVYFALHHGLLTDFIEPQNLFSLSLNSRPSQALDGCCGGGPEKEQLNTSWHIDLDKTRDHFHIQSLDKAQDHAKGVVQKRNGKKKRKPEREMQLESSPVAEMYDRLSKKRTSLL